MDFGPKVRRADIHIQPADGVVAKHYKEQCSHPLNRTGRIRVTVHRSGVVGQRESADRERSLWEILFSISIQL